MNHQPFKEKTWKGSSDIMIYIDATFLNVQYVVFCEWFKASSHCNRWIAQLKQIEIDVRISLIPCRRSEIDIVQFVL